MENPIILFWTENNYLNDMRNITHFTPNGDRCPVGIKSLTWKGGDIYANKGEDWLVDYWCESVRGIAIDEIINFHFKKTRICLEALRMLKYFSHGFVTVWHSVYLWFRSAKIYRYSVDLVVIQMYTKSGWSPWLWLRCKPSYWIAKLFKILDKTIFALKLGGRSWLAGVPNERILNKQMNFIKKLCPGMAGIGFFDSGAPKKLVLSADRLAGEIFE